MSKTKKQYDNITQQKDNTTKVVYTKTNKMVEQDGYT